MAQSNDDLLSIIIHADRRIFEDALQRLQSRRRTETPGLGILRDLLGALNAADLGPSELSSRASIVIKTCNPDARDHAALATLARGLRAELKTAVVGFLPPSQKKLVYADQALPVNAPSGTNSPPVAPPDVRAAEAPRGIAEPIGSMTVLLLGSQQDHEANITKLGDKGFTPLRVVKPEELDLFLKPDACGIIVSGGWWTALPHDQHDPCLRRLLEHSSFAWLKVDLAGFHRDDADLIQLCRVTRFREPSTFEISFQDGCQVHSLEFRALERASSLLSGPDRIQLCPAEIGEEQARVLLGATAQHVDGRNLDGPVRLSKVATATLPGGRSSALVVRVEPNDGGAPLVAKIDGMDFLREEMRRFHRFIQWSDQQLSPRLHFHAGTALIVFSLVDAPGEFGSAAPTLQDSIENAMWEEMRSPPVVSRAEENFAEAIDRSVRKLQRLNERVCVDTDTRSAAWLGLETLDAGLANGVGWDFTAIDGRDTDVLSLRHHALSIIEPRRTFATVHGDVHLRNILIRDQREPCFIDYAYSGPGHPCFDLVRLESAILFRCFRMTADESKVARVLLRILEGCDDESQIAAEFPRLTGSLGNRLAIRTCIRCRRAALEVLRAHGGSEEDYLAVKFVVAAQSLYLPELQTGVVRASLVAIHVMVAADWAPRGAVTISLPSRPATKVRELSPL